MKCELVLASLVVLFFSLELFIHVQGGDRGCRGLVGG